MTLGKRVFSFSKGIRPQEESDRMECHVEEYFPIVDIEHGLEVQGDE